MKFKQIKSAEELIQTVETLGFLPFFRNSIEGFSVEEMCPEELWFTDIEGPWEWKGPVARSKRCIYGKFFNSKAGFISYEWMPHFLNYRRNGYDFDSRCDEGIAPHKDKLLFEAVLNSGIILSKDLKKQCGFEKGFDTVVTRLQMQGYICIADFKYMQDKYGKTYGWGVAQYTTPEYLFGYDFITSAYKCEPEDSGKKILSAIQNLFPNESEEQLLKLIK